VAGTRAESLSQYLKKGSRVYVDGRLEARPPVGHGIGAQGSCAVAAGEGPEARMAVGSASRDDDERLRSGRQGGSRPVDGPGNNGHDRVRFFPVTGKTEAIPLEGMTVAGVAPGPVDAPISEWPWPLRSSGRAGLLGGSSAPGPARSRRAARGRGPARPAASAAGMTGRPRTSGTRRRGRSELHAPTPDG
jgi:hypothetical protein